jgi:D-arginine dehydrogenase
MNEVNHDVVVIGGGIAGVSAAYELSASARVLLLERESQLAYHSTGRSAAILTENYGNESIRLLTIASREFLAQPPACFGDVPLMHPRGILWLAREDQRASLARALELGQRFVPSIHRVDAATARNLCSSLRDSYVDAAMFEPEAMDLDVHAIHQGFLKGFRQRGGTVVSDAEVRGLRRDGAVWKVATSAGDWHCDVVINAAGAWADRVAARAGARSVGLVPKQRTGMLLDLGEPTRFGNWPCVVDVDETFYFKPESGRIMGSPADAAPVEPCDAQADELDIAHAEDRIERATTMQIRRVSHRWAGLRSFVPDGSPVVGPDPDLPGFFWLAGQGGYGVMTSPALARVTCGLVIHGALPPDLVRSGLTGPALAVDRLRASKADHPAK